MASRHDRQKDLLAHTWCPLIRVTHSLSLKHNQRPLTTANIATIMFKSLSKAARPVLRRSVQTTAKVRVDLVDALCDVAPKSYRIRLPEPSIQSIPSSTNDDCNMKYIFT